jgi:hypothetical protein
MKIDLIFVGAALCGRPFEEPTEGFPYSSHRAPLQLLMGAFYFLINYRLQERLTLMAFKENCVLPDKEDD